MSKCSCYYDGECWGTRERDLCSCNGNTNKCDFYPEKRNIKTFAVDFDGTLCKNEWPEIGEANEGMIAELIRLRQNGHKIILWTCREGEDLDKAVSWCAERGVFFDAINDNLEEHKQRFNGNSRKILADYYIDDKAIRPLPM